MRRVDKPWGHELVWAETQHYVGKVLHISPGEKLSRQYHEVKDETLLIISGEMILQLGAPPQVNEVRMLPGDTCHIPPLTVHRMIGVTEVTLVEVSTPQLDDVVRLEDSYGRAPVH